MCTIPQEPKGLACAMCPCMKMLLPNKKNPCQMKKHDTINTSSLAMRNIPEPRALTVQIKPGGIVPHVPHKLSCTVRLPKHDTTTMNKQQQITTHACSQLQSPQSAPYVQPISWALQSHMLMYRHCNFLPRSRLASCERHPRCQGATTHFKTSNAHHTSVICAAINDV